MYITLASKRKDTSCHSPSIAIRLTDADCTQPGSFVAGQDTATSLVVVLERALAVLELVVVVRVFEPVVRGRQQSAALLASPVPARVSAVSVILRVPGLRSRVGGAFCAAGGLVLVRIEQRKRLPRQETRNSYQVGRVRLRRLSWGFVAAQNSPTGFKVDGGVALAGSFASSADPLAPTGATAVEAGGGTGERDRVEVYESGRGSLSGTTERFVFDGGGREAGELPLAREGDGKGE